MEMNCAELAAVDGVACDLLDAHGRLVVTPNALTLDGQRNVPADLHPGESLAVFLERHVPGIASGAWTVSIGGATVPQAMWSRTFPKHGQVIACRAVVAKQVVQLAAIAALSYFTMGMGGIAGGAFLGLSGVAGYAAALGTFVAGSMLINKVLGPKVPKAGEAAAARQVHSLTSQRNSPRPYESMPTLWGEMRVTPDLAGQPYAWFEGDDQYLSTILLGGVNVHSVADLAIGDTPISSFTDATVFYNGFSGMPSQDVPLYGNADSIAGGELENNGQWVTRTSSAGTIALQVDIEGQLYDVSGDKFLVNSVPLFIETRPVGAGEWRTAVNETLSNAASDLMRRTFTIPVAQGQHEVRVRIGKPLWDEGEGKDACKLSWSVLKSIQPDTTDYSGWGRIGIKIKATGQISGSLDTLRATYRAKPLPLWNGAEWVTATTRAEGLSNCGAILLQTLRGVYGPDPITGEEVLQFGFGMSDEQIDIEGLKAFMLHCTARGYTYDRWITSSMSLGQFCEEVALAGMGEFSWTDGSRPTAVFVSSGQPLSGVVNMANMLKGSFSVAYNLANAADGIEYQYLDRDRNWETQTLRVAAPGVTTMLNPARITGEGVTTEAHAAVLARYHLAQSRYQYKTIDFGADIEHLAYRRLSVLSISHDLTQWGFGGRVMAAGLNAAGKVELQLDEPVPPMPQAYVGLRVPGARDYRVFKVEALEAESEWVTLVEPWPEDLEFPGEDLDNPAWDTLWCYDFKATPGYRVRVVGMQPEADLKGAQVTCVPEGPEFWDYVLNGTYTPAPNQSSLPQLGRPTVSNLRITEKVNVQGDTEWYSLSLVWDVEGDYDHAQVWAGRDGSELRLVDGNAVGSRAEFRIDGAGAWLVEVRPFNASGLVGQAATVLYITSMTQLPPRNVDDFVVQEVAGGLRRFAWQYVGDRPPAFAGVQIRYLPGDVALSVADWERMQPLGEAADIYSAQFETTRPQAGLWTFGCRAIDTAGQLANGVMRFVANLGDSFEQVQQPDPTPPPDVSGLAAAPMFSNVMVEWNVADYTQGHGHARTIVYAAQGAGSTFAQAQPVAEAFAGPVSFASEPATTWNIWAKHQTVDGTLSPNAVGPVNVTTAQDVDKVLESLKGKLSEDQLVQRLGERISLVDGTGPGSVTARLLAEAAETNARFSQEQTVRTREIEAEQQARAAADLLEAQTRASALAQQTQNLGNAVASLTEQIQQGDSSISRRLETVTATNYSRPNMLPGFHAWALPPTFEIIDGTWGEALYTWEGGTSVAYSPMVEAAGGVGYVLAFDSLRFAEGGSMYMDLEFFDANRAYIGETGQVMRFDRHDFREDDQNRLTNTFYALAPGGTAWVRARAVIEGGAGVTAVGWRQPKLERGSLPATRYTTEAQVVLTTAMVRGEEAARIDAVSAEARQRNDLAVQMRGNFTGSNLSGVTSGLMAQESAARVALGDALAYRMAMLSAGVGEQFDSAKIWYFDADGNSEGWKGRGPLAVGGGFMRLPDSTGWANLESPAGLAVDANTYRQVKMRIRKHGAPVWVGLLMWRGETEPNFVGERSVAVDEPSYDANGIALVTWEPTWSGSVYQINFDVYREQQPGGWFEIDWVAMGRPSPGASVALVMEEQSTRAAAVGAEADSRERLAVSLTGLIDPAGTPLSQLASGLLAEERNGRVKADTAEVIARQNLAATVSQGLADANAALQREERVRTDAVAAEASARQAMRAELYSRRNMCPDVFEWALPEGWAVQSVADWGMVVFCGNGSKIPAVGNVSGPAIDVQPNVTYTISGDTLLTAAGGFVAFDLIFKNAAGQVVLDSSEKIRSSNHDFTADGSGRRLTEVAALAPATAATVTPRFWWGDVSGAVNIGFRQVKVERGGLPSTPYSTEAESQALNASMVEEAWVRARDDAAEAYRREQFEAQYHANNVEVYGRLNNEERIRAEADSAEALARKDLEAAVSRGLSDANAALQREERVRADAVAAEASARQAMRAELYSRRNMCPDVFEWGLPAGWGAQVVADWGVVVFCGDESKIPPVGSVSGPAISVQPNVFYTIAGDTLFTAATGYVCFDLIFRNAAGEVVRDGPEKLRGGNHDFTADGSGRRFTEVAVVSPATAVTATPRFVWGDVSGAVNIGFRQVKVERGDLPSTPYSMEAETQNLNAVLVEESWTRAQADAAEAYKREQMEASLQDGLSAVNAAMLEERNVRAREDSAQVLARQQLEAAVTGRTNFAPDVQAWSRDERWSYVVDGWGPRLQSTAVPPSGSVDSPLFDVTPGVIHTVSGDSLFMEESAGSLRGHVGFNLAFFDRNNGLISFGPLKASGVNHDYSDAIGDIQRHAVETPVPNNAVKALVRFTWSDASGYRAIGFRRVKVERGGLPATQFSMEGDALALRASLQQESSVRAEQTGTLYGRVSVKLDLNGYMTGYGLLSESNNGVNTSTFAVRADRFVIGSASNNEVTPFYVEGSTTFMNMVVIRDGSIKNVMIQDASIESAKIVSLSVAKLVTGSLAVGQSIYSTGYAPGWSGWVIDGNGTAEFNNITVRGTIYALAGVIGGITVRGDTLTSGSFTAWGWPSGNGGGMALGPNGLLLGNPNTGRYFLVQSDGRIEMPGFSVIGGIAKFSGALEAATGTFAGQLTADAVNAVKTINIAGDAVTVPRSSTGGTFYGAGLENWQIINSRSIPMEQAGYVTGLLIAVQIHNFNSNNWRMRMVISHSGGMETMPDTGGAALTVSPAISMTRFVPAGNVTVTVYWMGGDANCLIASSELLVLGVKR